MCSEILKITELSACQINSDVTGMLWCAQITGALPTDNQRAAKSRCQGFLLQERLENR